MRPLSRLVTPWLLAVGIAGSASPLAAQVVVGGHVGISVGTPGPIAQPYPPSPPRHGYPAPGYPTPYPGAPGWTSPGSAPWAFEAGYDDGYLEGLRDGRRRHRYDPIGRKEFRRAVRGYHRNHAPRSFYEHRYRQGFRQGYERGYRDGTYASPGHGPRGRRGSW